jgi:hypothetical protein
MDTETVYDGYVEIHDDGSCLAQLLDLPGCYARGAPEQATLLSLAACIPVYFDWLRRHDEYTPAVHGPFRVVARERLRVSSGGAGGAGGAFFSVAAQPVADEDLDWSLALLDWAFEDLYRFACTAFTLGGQPADVAQHIADTTAQTQLWLTSRLELHPAPPDLSQFPGSSFDRLHHVWQATLRRLRNATDEERVRLLDHDGERWSLRKVLWRSVLVAREAADALRPAAVPRS